MQDKLQTLTVKWIWDTEMSLFEILLKLTSKCTDSWQHPTLKRKEFLYVKTECAGKRNAHDLEELDWSLLLMHLSAK